METAMQISVRNGVAHVKRGRQSQLDFFGEAFFGAAFALAQNARQLPANHLLLHAHPRFLAPAPRGHAPAQGYAHGIPGIDSLTNWNGSFHAIGFDPNGNLRLDPSGKAIFKPIIEFRDRATADRIGALVIELVRAAYLDAIDAA